VPGSDYTGGVVGLKVGHRCQAVIRWSGFQVGLRHRHSRVLLAGIQQAGQTGCPIEALGHDVAISDRKSTWKLL
jgi:hypothetical protein